MNDAPLISQNAAKGPWKNRISEEAVARILGLIATTPNRHRVLLEGDLVGHFDYWFDGGACAEMTGWNRFEFQDGTIADVGITPVLSVDITFPDGRRVQVQQHIQKS